MGDLKTSEAFVDAVFITAVNSKVGATGLTPTCYSVKASDNTRTLLTVAELGSGWYTASFTPDAAGTFMTEWLVSGNYVIQYPFKEFKVGGGRTEDINTALAVVDAYFDVPTADAATNTQINHVVGNKSDTAAGTSIMAILKKIDAKTTNLPSDPADDSDLDTAIGTRVATTDIAVPTADVNTNTNMRDVIGNKSDTVAGTSLVAISKQIKAKTDLTLLAVDIAVPTADVATNVNVRDVVGNKSDTVTGTSVVAIAKQIKNNSMLAQQTIATLNQGNPVSGNYYLVLDTAANVEVEDVSLYSLGGTPTNLYLKVTTDGVVQTYTVTPSVAGTGYVPLINHTDVDAAGILAVTATFDTLLALRRMSGRSVKVEAAVTWSSQSTSLVCRLKYAQA